MEPQPNGMGEATQQSSVVVCALCSFDRKDRPMIRRIASRIIRAPMFVLLVMIAGLMFFLSAASLELQTGCGRVYPWTDAGADEAPAIDTLGAEHSCP
jgi:hypothetical protein